VADTTLKCCGKCKQTKSVDQFNRCRSRKDGLARICRECDRAAQRARCDRNRQRSVIDVPNEKRCSACKLTKLADQFKRNRLSTDGLSGQCKSCVNEYRSGLSYDVSVCEKCCTRCKLVKSADQFSPNRLDKSGLAAWCKSCHREHGKQLEYDVDPIISEKRCTVCEIVKPIEQFSRNRRNRTGFQSRCRSCQKEGHRDYYVRNSETVIARTKLWATNNPEKVKILSRNRQRRRLYNGFTPEDFDRWMESQGGRCAGCGDEFGDTMPHIDHDHATGAVRGLLCGPCNKALGMALDSSKRLMGLARYLQSQNER
jgi:hypothetical protein